MGDPRHQEIEAAVIPSVDNQGVEVRVVAGEYAGTRGPVTEIAAEPLYLDIPLTPGAEIVLPVSLGHTVVAYLFEGQGHFGSDDRGIEQLVSSVSMIVFGDGDHIKACAAGDEKARFMLMAGGPFKEPIFPYGPFVMNTREEIQQALTELRSGTFVKDSAI